MVFWGYAGPSAMIDRLFFVLVYACFLLHFRTMSATIATPPSSRAFSENPIWVRVTTDTPISPAGKIVFTITSTGPSATETVRLQWLGNDLLFTISAINGEGASDLPLKTGGETLSQYADRFAEQLCQNETINGYFAVSRTSGASELVTLTQRLLEVVDFVVTETLTNVTVTPTDVTVVTPELNLRAFLQIWTDTGNLATDQNLIELHQPYNLSTADAFIDISPAFSILKPTLPAESSINPVVVISQPYAACPDSWVKYYLRYADKSGQPAIAQSLLKSSSYYAVLGGAAADSLHTPTLPLRHAYTRRDGTAFVKPTTEEMPDWLYWVAPSSISGNVYIAVTIYWSDGTESAYNPYGTTGVAVSPNAMYWFATGYRQLKLHTQTPPGGAEPDAYIVGYKAQVTRADAVLMLGIHSVTYEVAPIFDWGAVYLLFTNGVGGCESVALRGKPVEKWNPSAEEFQKPRNYGWTNIDGDFAISSGSGRRTWEANTGWFSNPYYLEHLRQLPIADAWLIDLVNRKFRKVKIEPIEAVVKTGDETIYSQSFTIRAGWQDQSANV